MKKIEKADLVVGIMHDIEKDLTHEAEEKLSALVTGLRGKSGHMTYKKDKIPPWDLKFKMNGKMRKVTLGDKVRVHYIEITIKRPRSEVVLHGSFNGFAYGVW
ncbi:hypothetical protein [Methanosarcina acetivorans]|nr:hypothetical protein [Methanosarcina acetivorans]